MEMAMEEMGDLQISISGCSSTTTTITMDDDMGGCAWDDFSPVVDWGTFSAGGGFDIVDDDFQGLIASMMGCDDSNDEDDRNCLFEDHQDLDLSYNSNSSSSATEVAVVVGVREEPNNSNEEEVEEDFKGLRLVHLLMAAAEALTGVNKSLDLARVILVRLKELVSPTNGTNMERLAAYFTDALQGLLEGSSSSAGGGKHSVAHHHRDDQAYYNHKQQQHHPSDVLAAFQLLQDMSPYVKFGHFTANQAILEAVVADRRVHIVDFDIMEGVQWASLIQALVSRKDGPPPPHLRITAIARSGGGGGCNGRKSIGTIQETGRRLAAFAASIGQPFSFAQCRLDPDDNFRPAGLKLVKGEALVVNCMLHLPHSSATQRPSASVTSFLSGARALNPRLITLVEEEVGPTGGERECGGGGGGSFVGQFMDSLHHYSAVYDSLEAGFPMQGRARALVERVFLGPRIAGTVGRVYRGGGGNGHQQHQQQQQVDSWSEWMGEMGFGMVGISFFNHCQAKLLLGLFNDGYRVEEVSANKLVLAWKSRRLLSASVWSSPPAASSTADCRQLPAATSF